MTESYRKTSKPGTLMPVHAAAPWQASMIAALLPVLIAACAAEPSRPGTAPASKPTTPRAAHVTKGAETMRIRLTVGGQMATAILEDNPTARDFASLLPVTVRMHDLFGREKPGPLPRALANGGSAEYSYEIGDNFTLTIEPAP